MRGLEPLTPRCERGALPASYIPIGSHGRPRGAGPVAECITGSDGPRTAIGGELSAGGRHDVSVADRQQIHGAVEVGVGVEQVLDRVRRNVSRSIGTGSMAGGIGSTGALEATPLSAWSLPVAPSPEPVLRETRQDGRATRSGSGLGRGAGRFAPAGRLAASGAVAAGSSRHDSFGPPPCDEFGAGLRRPAGSPSRRAWAFRTSRGP